MADISEADLHVVGDGVALGVVAGVKQLHEPSDILNRVEGLLRRLPGPLGLSAAPFGFKALDVGRVP